MGRFIHRSFRVFEAALKTDELAYRITRTIPRRSWALEQQLLRASSSIVLNIAEGVQETSPGEKARFYRFAMRSAAEAAAAFEILSRRQAIPDEVATSATEQLESVSAMLNELIRRIRTGRIRSKAVGRAAEAAKECADAIRTRRDSSTPRITAASRGGRRTTPQFIPTPTVHPRPFSARGGDHS